MQSCGVCGWDIAPGATTCAACRRAQQVSASQTQQAQLIASVLAQARAPRAGAEQTNSTGPSSPADGDQVVLREVATAGETPSPAVRERARPPAEIARALRRVLAAPAAPAEEGRNTPAPGAETGVRPAQPPDRDATAPLVVAFRDLGGWTAVAKLALVCVGALSLLQVLVLLIVSGALAAATGGDDADAAQVLAAYSKVSRVMLPALLMLALAALGFAAWRNVVERSPLDDLSRGRLLAGLPRALWALLAAITLLLVVVLNMQRSDVAGALSAAQWSIGACTLLALACFLSPRGVEAAEQSAREAPHAPSGSDTPGQVVPAAPGSRSAA